MNNFVNFFLRIRNSKIFSGIVISVILASALYAGVTSYDIPNQYKRYIDLFNFSITLFFVIEIIIRMVSERSLRKFFSDKNNYTLVEFKENKIPNTSIYSKSLAATA